MKNKQILSLVAAAAVSIPALANAQGGGIGGEIDSTIDFNLRITMEGPGRKSSNGFSSRFATTRFGSRDFIQAVGEMRVIDSAEVEAPTGFPRGSRLALIDGDVWIVSRDEELLMNVSDFFYFSIAAEPITAGTFRDGSQNTQTLYLASLGFNLEPRKALPTGAAEEGDDETFGEAQGIATNRFSYRSHESRNRRTESISSTTTGNVQGAGSYDGRPTVIEGVVRVRGREVNREDIPQSSDQ